MAGRQHERDQPSLELAVGRRLRRRGELAGVEAVELGDVGDVHREVVRIGEQVLLERGGQRGDALVEVLEGLLLGVVEAGAGQRHLDVPALDEVLLLGGQAARLARQRLAPSCSNTVFTRQ